MDNMLTCTCTTCMQWHKVTYQNYTTHNKQVTKRFSIENKHMYGWNPQKPTKQTPQYFLYTIPTSCAILPTMPFVGYLWAQKGCLWGARLWGEQHKRLQSCVGTRARLSYAAFDVQLRKAYFVTTLYAIRMSVHVQSCSHPQHNPQQHALHTHHRCLHAGPGIPGHCPG